jgi:flagellar biosynthesis protein FlhF
MQIRRYTGADLSEVLRRINRELGPNAAIINTRKIHQGGFFGVMGRSAIEVTVAVDYNFRLSEDAPSPYQGMGPVSAPAPFPEDGAGMAPYLGEARGGTAVSRRREPAGGGRPRFASGPGSSPASNLSPAVDRFQPLEDPAITARRELNQMKVAARPPAPSADPGQGLSDDLERVHRVLVRNQVDADISRQILRVFDEQLSLLGEDWTKAQGRFERYLAGMIRAVPGISLAGGRKPVVAMFIGPTGVGKTTTIAKIASYFSLMEHRRVAIVTADTYRLGATDQVRRYGAILGVPVRVVETPEDMEDTLLQLEGCDLVLVDTAGRSPQNKEQILQMKRLVESARPDEIHLVISMTTKYVDVMSIIARFGIVPVHRVILTKFDETKAFGLILNISMKFSMDIAYTTNGQQVPDDLMQADPSVLAKLVLAGTRDSNGRSGFPSS